MAEEKTRGTVWCAVIGLATCLLGGLLSRATSNPDIANAEVVGSLGSLLLVVGGLMLAISILVELFSIRPALARVDQKLSLLCEARKPEVPDRPRAA